MGDGVHPILQCQRKGADGLLRHGGLVDVAGRLIHVQEGNHARTDSQNAAFVQIDVRRADLNVPFFVLVDELHDAGAEEILPQLTRRRQGQNAAEDRHFRQSQHGAHEAARVHVHEDGPEVFIDEDGGVAGQRTAAPPGPQAIREGPALRTVSFDGTVQQNLPSVLAVPRKRHHLVVLEQHLHEGAPVAPEANVRDQRKILDEAAGLALRRLDGVEDGHRGEGQLPRFGKLSLSIDGRVHAAQVRERGHGVHPGEDLCDAVLRSGLHHAPLARAHRILDAGRDPLRIETIDDGEGLPVLHALGDVRAHALEQLSVELPGEQGEELARRLDPFQGEVVPVVRRRDAHEDARQLHHHDGEEGALPQKHGRTRFHALVGEELVLDDVFDVLKASLVRGLLGALTTDVFHDLRTRLQQDLRHVQRPPQDLHGLLPLRLQAAMCLEQRKHLLEALEPEDLQEGAGRDLHLDEGQTHHQNFAELAGSRAQVHEERAGAPSLGGVEAAHLRREGSRTHGADEDEVGAHLLLCDDHFLLPVADEIAPGVETALAGGQRHVSRAADRVAGEAAHHARQAAEEHLVEELLRDDAVEKLLLEDVDVDRDVVGETSHSTLVRGEFSVGAVRFTDARTPDVDLLEGALGGGEDGPVAPDGVLYLAVLEHDLLEFGAYETVKGLDLVARETSEGHPGLEASSSFGLGETV